MTESDDLAARSAAFAAEVQHLLDAVLPHDREIVSVALGHRYVVRPDGDDSKSQTIPLLIGGKEYASLGLKLYQELDRTQVHLKTSRTDFAVYSTLQNAPLLRLEYRSDMRSDPISHWQFHAERGAFASLLSMAHVEGRVALPHDLSKLHLTTGGERFRPGLEDLLEFLVTDCGIDACQGWRNAVEDGRETWRRRQLRACVRDLQKEAAEALRAEGWELYPPATIRPEHVAPYRSW